MAIALQANQPNREQPKKVGKDRFAHTANTKFGMGDNYGSGIKAKLGTMREGVGMVKLSQKKLGTPPRSLV
jgi:hypothetical protein